MKLITIKKYAAIDIGSNAIRLLITSVVLKKNELPKFKKTALVRVPIRLGIDSFVRGSISKKNTERLANTIEAFSLLIKVHEVTRFRACATSAMREASNRHEVVEKIYSKTGIKIDIISGKEEATIISSTNLHQLISGNGSYLYVDVGGGSTELTFFSKGKIVVSKSFKIGTVRLLNKSEEETEVPLIEFKKWIKFNKRKSEKIALIGSGGNINKLFKMSRKKEETPLTFPDLKEQYRLLISMSYDDRVTRLGLNPDRADVIVPATKIYLSIMKWSGAHEIYVPRIGLVDGIVKNLFYKKI